MAGSEALGIIKLHHIVFYVIDIERSHRFYQEKVDFAFVARTTPAHEDRSHERASIFQAGDARVKVVAPAGPQSSVARYLKRHPDGIAKLVFEVSDVEATFKTLDERRATIIADIAWEESSTGGRIGAFEIATPFGEAIFRFEQRSDAGLEPGFEAVDDAASANRFGLSAFDHVTSNFLTLEPMALWCKQVLGLEEYWSIEFHTDDVAPDGDHGSGLKSTVFWDPHSGIKFANNEPKRPYFEASQIYHFVIDNRGPGIQHAAITTSDIIGTVTGMRANGVGFMHTPGEYYDALPGRIEATGIDAIDEDIAALRELGILVDGEGHRKYLLQIFLKEGAGLYKDEDAGPFFFEIIQRKGDNGFGGGNFRALFESIEAEQKRIGSE